MFVCEVCGCVENTGCGNWWTRFDNHKKVCDIPDGTALCSACTPTHYKSGEVDKSAGKWHMYFTRRLWDGKTQVLNMRPEDYENYIKKFEGKTFTEIVKPSSLI
jgi:hypothetical protein